MPSHSSPARRCSVFGRRVCRRTISLSRRSTWAKPMRSSSERRAATHIWVDAGGRLERGAPQTAGSSTSEEVGERIVVPFLIREGIHHLDAVLLSHPHGGSRGRCAPRPRHARRRRLRRQRTILSGSHAYHDALDIARDRHIPMLEPRGGDVWHTGRRRHVSFLRTHATVHHGIAQRHQQQLTRLPLGIRFVSHALHGRRRSGKRKNACWRAETISAPTSSKSAITARPTERRPLSSAPWRHATRSFPSGATTSSATPLPQRSKRFARTASATYRTDRDGAVTIRTDGTTFCATPFL